MPTRREVLAGGLALGTSLAGCLTAAGVAVTGYLQVKVVQVGWRFRGRRYRDEILLAVSDGRSHLDVRVAGRYAHLYQGPGDIRVGEEAERGLLEAFTEVTYGVGFCWREAGERTCRNPQAGREAFNRVQFGDRAEVVFDSPGVHVVDVYDGAQGDPTAWDLEYDTIDFGALHEAHGVPV